MKDLPSTLHVSIITPLEIRVSRIMDHAQCDEKQAVRILHHSENKASGFVNYLFDINIDELSLYIDYMSIEVKEGAVSLN